MIQITYKKRNGEIFNRYRSTYCSYRVGDITSMGWEVVDIKHKWKDKYYNYSDYCKLVDEAFNKEKNRRKTIRNIKKFMLNINQLINFFILFKIFIFVSNKAILGINIF